MQFEVAMGACNNRGCPVLVSLIQGKAILDQTSTQWSSSSRELWHEDLEAGWGVGDPVGSPNMTAWATGEEEGYLGMVIRGLRVAPRVYGLLIDQRGGFEHLKRRHELYVVLKNQLKRVWEAAERVLEGGSSPFVLALPGIEILRLKDALEQTSACVRDHPAALTSMRLTDS